MDRLDPRGFFLVEHIRNGCIIDLFNVENGVTIEGRVTILNTFFKGDASPDQNHWGIGLIDYSGFVAAQTTDTWGSRGWSEFNNYSLPGSVTLFRAVWGPTRAPLGQAILTNATPLLFTFTGVGQVTGIFVIENTTKNDSGVLWSTALFPATLSVNPDDILRITYTLVC